MTTTHLHQDHSAASSACWSIDKGGARKLPRLLVGSVLEGDTTAGACWMSINKGGAGSFHDDDDGDDDVSAEVRIQQ